VHEHSKKFIVHMCGHLKDMLPIIKDIELDGIEAATPGPTGNAEPDEMRRVLGDVIIMGGVDPTRYAIQGPAEMVKTLRERLSRIKGDRHFILGSEEIPVSAKLETVKAVGEMVARTGEWFYA
jgi:uroporphyrinogen-III decarboxylase